MIVRNIKPSLTIDEPETDKNLVYIIHQKFAQNYFEILRSSLINYHNRSLTEANLIKIHNPTRIKFKLKELIIFIEQFSLNQLPYHYPRG